MSNLPLSTDPHKITNEDSEFMGPLDFLYHNSWSLYQEILQSDGPDQSYNLDNYSRVPTDSPAEVLMEVNGLRSMKISSPKSKARKKISDENGAILEQSAENGATVAKKMDHNAKERIRRMKLNASYLALRALLLDSRRSKKRSLSAPAIVDRILKYIPELEKEVEALRSHKENMQSEAKNNINGNPSCSSDRTVSLNQVNEEEAIIQICMAREDELDFINLLQSMEEDDGICSNTASALHICDSRICYNIHIQINATQKAYYNIEELKDKVISWLR